MWPTVYIWRKMFFSSSILMKNYISNLNRAVQFLESQLEKFLLDFEETSERNGESFSAVDCWPVRASFWLPIGPHLSCSHISHTWNVFLCDYFFVFVYTGIFVFMYLLYFTFELKPCRDWWIARLLISDWSVSAAPMVAMLGQRDSATLHISSPPSVLCLCVFLFS